MSSEPQNTSENPPEEYSFLRVIVHSFFIIPFLIAVFCVLLFGGIHLLTQEKRSVYDYLEDVKTGGHNKRWQGAFELSKILSNPAMVPQEERFENEMINAFEQARHDDNRVRQYLALAMGRTQNMAFSQALAEGFINEKEENLPALIYAIGQLGDTTNAPLLHDYADHSNARIRSIAVVAMGNLGNSESLPILKKALKDFEPNVQWGSAISLAQMGDLSGKEILMQLLDRSYLDKFPEVDRDEKNNLILSAISASSRFGDPDIRQRIQSLSASDQNMKIRAAAMKQIQN